MTNLGSNVGYVDELYARYLADPASVSEAWREFFADYQPAASPGPRSWRRRNLLGRHGPTPCRRVPRPCAGRLRESPKT